MTTESPTTATSKLGEPLSLSWTNVSSPSIIHPKPSQQSITASEDYYSLSGSQASEDTVHRIPSPPRAPPPQSWEAAQRASLLLQQPGTPPLQYRTPLQSSTNLATQPSTHSLAAAVATPPPQDATGAGDIAQDAEVRKTPMRGEGKRRSSQSYPSDTDIPPVPALATAAGATAAGAGAAGAAALKEGGIRRKPVPSTVMEGGDSPASQEFISQNGARSSVARDLDREAGDVSPPVDDTPFIRFALDQLTRDEEVRGSRRYPGVTVASAEDYAGARDVEEREPVSPISPQQSVRIVDRDPAPVRERDPGQDDRPGYAGMGAAAAIAAAAGAGGLAAGNAMSNERARTVSPPQSRPVTQIHAPVPPPIPPQQRPSRDGRHSRQESQPNLFIPVSNEQGYHQPLDFLPTILRPLWFSIFLLHVIGFLALLILCAVWSLTHNGIFNYGSFGDSKYFLFEYLPILLGMVILYWLIQIQVAVYRIAPFIAMASDTVPKSREEGANLPLYPETFVLPYLGHFRARQPIVGFFMLTAWLQIFTIPLLASSFNVNTPSAGSFRWIATAAAIWTVIALYIILLIAAALLFFWLLSQRRKATGTGVRWDPRSPADLIVLLERSNALSLSEEEEVRLEAPKLGYWRTSRGGNEVFHCYAIEGRSARRYSLENGRIREKVDRSPIEPKSRFSDFEDDRGMGREQRNSREKMLPRNLGADENEAGLVTGGRAVPWFLKPSLALLWIVIAFVLLIAFLVVSYLPSTAVTNGFSPGVPATVSGLGYSGVNFLYSFIPALLAVICFLGILDIDYAYRRLQPFASLMKPEGELAEKSLLLSYPADLPGFVTIKAFVNGHWRIAALSLASFFAIPLPILGGGVFFALWDGTGVRVWAQMSGYYALTFFVAIYALAIIALVWPSKSVRDLDRSLPLGNHLQSFKDILRAVRMSRMLDDVAFHAVVSKTDLVTRLLSAPPGSPRVSRQQPNQPQPPPPVQDPAASKVSLADSVRGFGRARQQAAAQAGNGASMGAVPRYALGRYVGRDGKEYVGVDRVRL